MNGGGLIFRVPILFLSENKSKFNFVVSFQDHKTKTKTAFVQFRFQTLIPAAFISSSALWICFQFPLSQFSSFLFKFFLFKKIKIWIVFVFDALVPASWKRSKNVKKCFFQHNFFCNKWVFFPIENRFFKNS